MPLKIVSFFALLLTVILSGCSGGVSGENGSDPFGSGGGGTTDNFTLSLALSDQQCASVAEASFTAGETVCVQATLQNNSENISGQIVNFNTGLGTLSVSSKLTNSLGVAEIILSSEASNIGASTLTATFGDISAQINYEFLASDAPVIAPPSMNLVMLKSGQPSARFKADEDVQLQSTILNQEGLPVEGVIVNFVVGKGVLNTSDALTDSQGVAQVSLTGNVNEIGAAVATAQARVNSVDLVSSVNFEIQSIDAISDQLIRVGHFADDGSFVENEIGVSATNASGEVEISAGATLGLSVALVDQNDQRILTQTPISFTSTCVEAARSTIDRQVNTINGVAQATYEDSSCAGSEGNVDTIVASLIVDNSTVTLTRSITIQAESIGSIGFVSASPTQIVLQGTGGQNNETVSTLVFEVLGALGNPLSQQEVTFALNTATGGLALSPVTGITNSQGQVSTRVTSGSVPTSVRVTAEISASSGDTIRTQSDLLTVNTGLPDQNSMSLSANVLNPEADSIDGQQVNVVIRLADTFNNPVPDGTAVSFTSEGGIIQPSCVTANGTCSVVWTSSAPRVFDHTITILATAIGHETLLDSNGNNTFDDADGVAIIDGSASGFGGNNVTQTGFLDMSEAWRDDNADGMRNPSEIFLDFNNNQQFDSADGLFNGPQCQSSNLCGQGLNQTLHVRESIQLVMSSSNALWYVYKGNPEAGGTLAFSNDPGASAAGVLNVASGESAEIFLVFTDLAGRVMPNATRVGTVDVQNILSTVLYTVPNDNGFQGGGSGHVINIAQLDNSGGTLSTQNFSFIIEAPSGARTIVAFTVN